MKQRQKYGWMNVVDNFIWAGIGALCVVIYYLDTSTELKIVYYSLIGVFSIFYMWFVYYKATNDIVVLPAQGQSANSMQTAAVTQIVLLNEQQQPLKKWDLVGKAGLIIGKSSAQGIVDIDLSDTAMATLISEEHALLNYTGNSWFVEDYDSEQGTGLRKYNESSFTLLSRAMPRKLDCGDCISVGKTILQVR